LAYGGESKGEYERAKGRSAVLPETGRKESGGSAVLLLKRGRGKGRRNFSSPARTKSKKGMRKTEARRPEGTIVGKGEIRKELLGKER